MTTQLKLVVVIMMMMMMMMMIIIIIIIIIIKCAKDTIKQNKNDTSSQSFLFCSVLFYPYCNHLYM